MRWTVCAVLAAAAAVLAFSMLDRSPAPAEIAQPSSTSVAPAGSGRSASETPVASAAVTSSATAIATATVTAATPTAGDGPPLRPDAAKGLTVASAESFVMYFVTRAGNYLKQTGDGSAWLRASSPACKFCSANATYFAATNGRNERLTGAYTWREVTVRSVRLTGPRSAAVDVNVRTGRHSAVEKPGAPAKPFPGGVQYYAITLAESGGSWTVLDVRFR